MNYEVSHLWNPARDVAYRVIGFDFYGPWCYSLADASWQWARWCIVDQCRRLRHAGLPTLSFKQYLILRVLQVRARCSAWQAWQDSCRP